MPTYQEVSGSTLIWILVLIGLGLICLLCVAFFVKTRRRALELGVSKETIKKINRSALMVTIIPALTIVMGLFALAAVVGLPWATFRLSVIGAMMYEVLCAQMAVSALGYSDITAAAAGGGQVFGAIMFVMSLGIIIPPILNAIVSKPLSQGLQKEGTKGTGFAPILSCCFLMAVYAVMVPNSAFSGIVNIAVLLTSAAVSFVVAQISSKTSAKWLAQFSLPLCLIIGMASSFLWVKILP